MQHRTSLAFILIFLLALQSTVAQQSTAPPRPPVPSPATASIPSATPPPQNAPSGQDDDVVRITTNLVQIDAVVTDREGRQVTDLRAEDFEILENDRPQAITNFSYISVAPATQPATSMATTRTTDRNSPGMPPARLRADQVRRTIALVVDDFGLSFESIYFVRRALRRFVDEQMQPGDLVAIVSTRAGVGALQQFTSDRQQLYAAIERVRWSPNEHGRVSAFSSINPLDTIAERTEGEGADRDRSGLQEVNDFREGRFSIGTLGALIFVVRGMREMPGRKAVVMMSDGLPIQNRAGLSSRILERLNVIIELANRSSVVFYTIDSRGLQTLSITADEDTTSISPQGEPDSLSPDQSAQVLIGRSREMFEGQNGLNYLAQRTGGFMVANNNDIASGLRRVLNDQRGYYLLGYLPDEATFDRSTGQRRFYTLRVRVRNRPELRVRSRSGFYGVTDEQTRPLAQRTRIGQLAGALTSPFATGGVSLRLTSLFGNDAQTGSFMRSMLHINARDFTFTRDPDGWHRTVMDVLAVTFGDNEQVIDEVNRTETLRIRGRTYERFLREGLIYFLNVPVRQPGAYQLRVAVRDVATERTGSASQFIEVPDLRRNRLALSGLVVTASNPSPTRATNTADTRSGENAEGLVNEGNIQLSLAVRRFRQGMFLDYGYAIYNARLDRTSRRPQLTTQLRLFRDGQEVFAGQPQPFDARGQTDLERLTVGGRLRLGTELPPGEYVLQVVVTDALVRNERQRTATQWIDFEIVR